MVWSRPLSETAMIGFIKNRFPNIIISAKAAAKMDSLVACCSIEISWYATSHKEGDDYVIDDVFVPPQVCSMGETKFFEADLYSAFMDKNGKINPKNLKMISNLHVWGHSHHNMQTNPSGTDDRQSEAFIDTMSDYYIRLICNKRGDMHSSLYLLDRGLVLYHPTLVVEPISQTEFPYDSWAINQINTKVTRRQYSARPAEVTEDEWQEWLQLGRESGKEEDWEVNYYGY